MTRRKTTTVKTTTTTKTHRGSRSIWKEVERKSALDGKYGIGATAGEHARHADGPHSVSGGAGSGAAGSGTTSGPDGARGTDGHGHSSPSAGFAAATSLPTGTAARGAPDLDTPADAGHPPRSTKPDGSPIYRFTEEPAKQHRPNA